MDIFSKTGRDLLPEEIVDAFKEIRGIDYYRVLNNTLSEYTAAEHLVCLRENVLLEYCLPFFIDKLDLDPLIPGYFRKGEILYYFTKIDKSFWVTHKDWYEHTREIVKSVIDMSEEKIRSTVTAQEYIEAYKSFYYRQRSVLFCR